ncbi:MAG: S41 family peptidase [Gemmataceae bacterium]|nr:S41 family peptidase [Gemmataceae bacterium]
MKGVLLASLVGGLVLAAALAPRAGGNAAAPEPGAQKWLLLVGVSQYAEKSGILPRKHPEADARALFKVLVSADHGMVPADNARLLVGKPAEGEKEATKAAFLESLKWLAKSAKAGDTVTVGFFGQGGPLGPSGDGHCYFVSGSTFKGRAKDAVTGEEVEEALKGLKAKNVLALIDVDFTGFEQEKGKPIAAPTLGRSPFKEFVGEDSSEEHLPLPGRLALVASRGAARSLDLDKHGAFASVLLEALEGKADGFDGKDEGKADGLVTADEAARWFAKKLPELTRKHGKTDKEKDADYDILYSKDVSFAVSHNPPENKKRVEALKLLDEAIKDKKLSDKKAQEARVLLDRMPRLKAKQQMRAAYLEFLKDTSKKGELTSKLAEIERGMKMSREDADQFATKVLEAVAVIQEQHIKPQPEPKMVANAVRSLYLAADEKLSPELAGKLEDTAKEGLHDLLSRARQKLGQREDLEGNKDLSYTLQGMLTKVDPHTTYFDPESKKKMDDDIDGRFRGIGVQIRKDLASDQLFVVTPIKGSPAYKKKLYTGDLITRVKRQTDSEGNPLANEKDKDIPTKGMPLNKIVKIIMGLPGTDVTLSIKREGVKDEFDVTITRGTIETESVLGAKRKDDDGWDYVIDQKSRIGYVRLTSFARNSYRDMERVMKQLVEEEKIKGFVLDLRFNPGGLLDAAVKISDLFVDDGIIVTIRHRGLREKETRFKGKHAGSLLNFPMVCLVNGYSASGSEIVSAALQDHERARIVGERSYGKGSVQNLLPFEVSDPKTGKKDVGDIKLTTATFWRPNEKNLNKASTPGKESDEWGVTPDHVVKLTLKERRDLSEHQHKLEVIERPDTRGKAPKSEFKDKQLEFALEYLRGQIKLAAKAPPVRRGEG